jgi:hypothetical protein
VKRINRPDRTAVRDSVAIEVLVGIAASYSFPTRPGYCFSDQVWLGAPLAIASVLPVVFAA